MSTLAVNTLRIQGSQEAITIAKNCIEALAVGDNGLCPFVAGLAEGKENLSPAQLNKNFLGSEVLIDSAELSKVAVHGDGLEWTFKSNALPYIAFANNVIEKIVSQEQDCEVQFVYFNNQAENYGEFIVNTETGACDFLAEHSPRLIEASDFAPEVSEILMELGVSAVYEDVPNLERYIEITGEAEPTMNEIKGMVEYYELSDEERNLLDTAIAEKSRGLHGLGLGFGKVNIAD